MGSVARRRLVFPAPLTGLYSLVALLRHHRLQPRYQRRKVVFSLAISASICWDMDDSSLQVGNDLHSLVGHRPNHPSRNSLPSSSLHRAINEG